MLEEFKHEIFDCTRCGFCREWHWKGIESVCPIYPFTPGFEVDYARGKVRMARALLENKVEITDSFVEHAFMCTLCGSCEAHCPVGMPLNEIFHAWRVDLAEAGYVLPAHQRVISIIKKYRNPYGPRQGGKGDSPAARSGKASILFYPGCTTTRMAEEIVQSITDILDKLELDYALFEDDTCCGFPLYDIGQMSAMRDIATTTLDLIQQREPDIVLTSCPACYKAFKFIYPEELGLSYDFKVQHISEFLLTWVSGRLSEVSTKVTWHDPCILGRHLGMYDEPREVLRAIPGLELIEMQSNRKDALCCGAGGGVYFFAQGIARQAVANRLEQAKETGAQQIVTSCPNCYVRFRQAVGRFRMDLRVRSLAALINEALT